MKLRAIVGAVGMFQTLVQARASMERHTRYKQAVEISEESSKPLLVIGGPAAGQTRNLWVRMMRIPHHGCGDVCLDIDESTCRTCGDDVEVVEADVRSIPYPDGSFSVAYIAHVLEHLPSVDDAMTALEELHRLADEVIIVSPSKADMIAWLHPGHHLWVKQEASGDVVLQQR